MQNNTTKNGFSRKIRRLLSRVSSNKKYRDTLFRFIFKDKEKLLSLYNALNGSNYTDSSELQILTKEDVIYMQMKEDVSFLIASTLSLYEHQSTWNPNMPIRGLIYLSTRYEEIIRKQDLDIYGRKLVLLPTPRYVVFYNGDEDGWEKKELCLSEAFSVKAVQPAIEVIVTVLNINYSHNHDLLMQCKPLQEYSYFVAKVKEYQKSGKTFEVAMELAIDHCIAHHILTDILSESRGEVRKMLLTEYNPKKHIRNEKQISYEEGIEEGIEKGIEKERIQSIPILINTLRETGMSNEEITQTIRRIYQLDDEAIKSFME